MKRPPDAAEEPVDGGDNVPETLALDPDRPFGGPPMYQKPGMASHDLWEDRICWIPPASCHGCRHLGPPVDVRTPRGDRRVRRACANARGGYTAPDWPACDSYERLSAADPALSRDKATYGPKEPTNDPFLSLHPHRDDPG